MVLTKEAKRFFRKKIQEVEKTMNNYTLQIYVKYNMHDIN